MTADSGAGSTWDRRYAGPEYEYGTAPNGFLLSVVDRLPLGRVLSLGEGEGRNAVFLAKRGAAVTAVDGSAVGLEKARRLAADRGVRITTIHADLADFTIDPHAWDVVVSIFCHLAPGLRRRVHRAAADGLTPGGAVVLEAYTPAQLAFGTGGPPTAELMMTLADLRDEFLGLEFEIGREIERDVSEGVRHRGRGAVVQVLARRPRIAT